MAPVWTALIIAPDSFPDKYASYDAACRALNLEPNGHGYLVCLVTTAAGSRTLLAVDLTLLPDHYEAGIPDQASVPGTDRSEEAASKPVAPNPLEDLPDQAILQDRDPLETHRGPHVGPAQLGSP
jgi:hypothetical protein